MRKSPAFSSFRYLMDLYDEVLEEEAKENKVRSLLDGHILFFKKKAGIFGAPEESRVTFARLKNPEEDDVSGFQDEATFMALNLLDALTGKSSQSLFGFKDLPDIKVLDRDECEKILLKKAANPKPVVVKGDIQGDDDGLIKITDEE